MRTSVAFSTILALAAITGCKTANSAVDAVKSAGETVADGAVSLVNVDLSNVLNDLSLDLNIDKANIPINAQIPINIAANVCGVSVSALAASIASGQAGCTATTSSPQLAQAVQQQVAAGGDVQGGDQTMGTPTSNII